EAIRRSPPLLQFTQEKLFGAGLGDDAATGLLLGFGLLLLDLHGLVDPIVGGLDILLVVFLVFVQIGALADEKVLIRHGVVVIGVDLQGFVETVEAVLDDTGIFGLQLLADLL